jgi:hypothetical protein
VCVWQAARNGRVRVLLIAILDIRSSIR